MASKDTYRRKKPRGLPPRRTNHRITLATAVGLTQRYRKAAPASEHGGFFWAKPLQDLLAQPGVVGMRFYHGLDARGRYRLVLVGVDGDGKDVVRATVRTESGARVTKARVASATMSGDALILDTHWPCPPVCWPDSPLS